MDPSTLAGLVLVAIGIAALFGMGGFAVVSLRERERRAATVACFAAVAVALFFLWSASASETVRTSVLALIVVLGFSGTVAWFLPIGASPRGNGRPRRRVDERDIMFARALLKPGTRNYDRYYAMRPENKKSDERTRALPGLLSADAALAEPKAFASAKASFRMTRALRNLVDGPVAPVRSQRPASETTAFVKQLVFDLGAHNVGVAELRPYHVYSHVGRGSGTWGEPIDLDHCWAIAFTVEMDHRTMRCAPAAPVVAESAGRYVDAANIAVKVAAALRSRGYPARAHIVQNYRVIAPLVAADAGLGELGRMGILMTPELGPRVRLGVVTTDAPLVPDPPGDDASAIDFCTVCKKCADNCPSDSISFDDREPIDGGLRWAIDSDSCFRYWSAVGSDCGRCMTVCPYSHPDNAAHNAVRWAIRRSGFARRGALLLDDLFYGRRPTPTRFGD